MINHYFLHAPFYGLLIYPYTVMFFIIYYAVLVQPLKCSLLKKIGVFFSAVLFTLVYTLAESLARLAVKGRLIPGVNVPEFFFLLVSFVACLGIILAQRRKDTRDRHPIEE